MKGVLNASLLALAGAGLLLAGTPGSASQAGAAASAAPDYEVAANWVCRPGHDEVCTTGLDARVTYPDGHSEVQPFVPAASPAIDCFYVYPTVSRELTPYADMADSPEVQATTKSQVGRLSSRCRVFAPIYRQATLQHLRERMAGGGVPDWGGPLEDVTAAWNWYLQHENHGRGVVLIGHSQGTILLQELMQKSIDGTPVRSLLVSAFLAGDPSLGVPPGKKAGGTFKNIPVCSHAAETGCAYAWGSYFESNTSETPVFGAARKDGLVSACENPAAPEGGTGALKPYLPNRQGESAEKAAFVDPLQQLTGGCEEAHGAHVFEVHVAPTPAAMVWSGLLPRSQSRPTWGIHALDLNLVEGNILDVLDAEIATWKSGHKG